MPQPYSYPYHTAVPQSPSIIPVHSPLSPLSPAARAPAYISPVYYWPYPSPYPSPPVSPTSYYQHNGPTVVVMRGLPFNASMADILNFFHGFPEVCRLYFFSGVCKIVSCLLAFLWSLQNSVLSLGFFPGAERRTKSVCAYLNVFIFLF